MSRGSNRSVLFKRRLLSCWGRTGWGDVSVDVLKDDGGSWADVVVDGMRVATVVPEGVGYRVLNRVDGSEGHAAGIGSAVRAVAEFLTVVVTFGMSREQANLIRGQLLYNMNTGWYADYAVGRYAK